MLGKFNFVKEKGTNIPFVRTPNQFPMVISILFNNWRVKKETAKTVFSSSFFTAAAAAAKTIFRTTLFFYLTGNTFIFLPVRTWY